MKKTNKKNLLGRGGEVEGGGEVDGCVALGLFDKCCVCFVI